MLFAYFPTKISIVPPTKDTSPAQKPRLLSESGDALAGRGVPGAAVYDGLAPAGEWVDDEAMAPRSPQRGVASPLRVL